MVAPGQTLAPAKYLPRSKHLFPKLQVSQLCQYLPLNWPVNVLHHVPFNTYRNANFVT